MARSNRLAIDAVAGAAVGGAICLAFAALYHMPLLAGAGGAAAVLVSLWASSAAAAGSLAISAFVPQPLEFDADGATPDASEDLREALDRLRRAVR